VREGEIYNQMSVPFEPGDLLLLYSDGITEARNPARELWGVERLEEFVQSHRGLEPAALIEALRDAVFAFSQTDRLSDDLTSVAIRGEQKQLPLARAETEIGSDVKHLCRARKFVRDFCSVSGLPDGDFMCALELAVNEAASNIMKHAYHGRTDQRIQLEAELFPGHVLIRLHHVGEPFDPSRIPPPPFDGSRESGFGAYIIMQCVDDAQYCRDEFGRNCVALTKVLRTQLDAREA
jgi:anti-sigma regulatory factor (Ser/Thr protein kinase)